MCGIIGWIKGASRNNIEEIWNRMYERGDYSMGLVGIGSNKFEILKIAKITKIPNRFFEDYEIVIGHIRSPTTKTGFSKFIWEENHPFIYGNAILIMNGILSPNYYKKIKDDIVDNDTYYLLKQIKENGFEILNKVEGVYAVSYFCRSLYLFRNAYPIYYSDSIFSSVEFKNSKLLEEHIVFDFLDKRVVFEFNASKPYIFLDEDLGGSYGR